MPQLKDFLTQQVSVPMQLEASLPQGMPKLSGILSQIASGLPATPDLGGAGMAGFQLPGMNGGLQLPANITNVIKGIEGPLPEVFPKMSGLALNGFRPMETQQAEQPAKVQPAIMGGGYRPMSI